MNKGLRADGSFIDIPPALQQWVDMYNKADKEKFNAELERDLAKKCLEDMISYLKQWEDSADSLNELRRIQGAYDIYNNYLATKENK